MAVLDDNDPVSVLTVRIFQVLDKQDIGTTLAALASVLATTIAYTCSKSPARPPHALITLRDACTSLTADIVRDREHQKHERS